MAKEYRFQELLLSWLNCLFQKCGWKLLKMSKATPFELDRSSELGF